MAEQTIHSFSTLVSKYHTAKQVIVVVAQASIETTDADGNIQYSYLTDAQIDVARDAAKACLQTCGATVSAYSTAFILPAADVTDDEQAKIKVDASIVKTTD